MKSETLVCENLENAAQVLKFLDKKSGFERGNWAIWGEERRGWDKYFNSESLTGTKNSLGKKL